VEVDFKLIVMVNEARLPKLLQKRLTRERIVPNISTRVSRIIWGSDPPVFRLCRIEQAGEEREQVKCLPAQPCTNARKLLRPCVAASSYHDYCRTNQAL
jgi:hypothetical protein